MAESPADRRERIAEMIYAAMISSSEWASNTNADLYYEARKAADVFLAHAPEQPQPQPSADASPSLLEAAKEVVHAAYCAGVNSQFSKAYNRLIDAIKREETRRG